MVLQPHIYNTMEEIDVFVAALAEVIGALPPAPVTTATL
jgi:selenocysteine lyase/cysteine desulfurase